MFLVVPCVLCVSQAYRLLGKIAFFPKTLQLRLLLRTCSKQHKHITNKFLIATLLAQRCTSRDVVLFDGSPDVPRAAHIAGKHAEGLDCRPRLRSRLPPE